MFDYFVNLQPFRWWYEYGSWARVFSDEDSWFLWHISYFY